MEKNDFGKAIDKFNKKYNTLHVHDDIEDAAKFYKIPFAMWSKNDVYIMQEDRCVFLGNREIAKQFLIRNKDKFCESRFPL